MSEQLSLAPTSGGTERRPGDTLELIATWTLAEPPKSLDARLLWCTRGKGTEDIGVVERKPIEQAAEQGERRLRFKLPDVPYSFSGRLISLVWVVELVANESDDVPVAKWEFVMAPEGREILLESNDATRIG